LPIKSVADLIILLLHAKGKITKTQLEKLIYSLSEKQLFNDIISNEVSSMEQIGYLIDDLIECLKEMKIVSIRNDIYSLTADRGLRVAEMLTTKASQEEIQIIECEECEKSAIK